MSFSRMISVLSVLLLALNAGQAQTNRLILKSPGGRVVVSLGVWSRPGLQGGEQLAFNVRYNGGMVLLDSPFGLSFRGSGAFSAGLEMSEVSRRTVDQTWNPVWGTHDEVRNHFNELTLALEENGDSPRRIELVWRAYEDGVAFRYRIPEQKGLGSFQLAAEETRFHFRDDHTVWAANYGGYRTNQESEFVERPLSILDPDSVYGVPLLVEISRNAWMGVTESNLVDWAGLHLSADESAPNTLVTKLASRLDNPNVVVASQAPRLSPWRVLMLGSTPGALIESNLVLNLADPVALDDTSWIKPGISAWDRWWSGSYAPNADFEVGVNTETLKFFTDFAAEMGWEYVLVDWWWYGNPFDADFNPLPDMDITRAIPEVDLQEVIRYANGKGVDVLLWLQWKHAQEQMAEAFPLYESWGIKGVKVDFMDRDDQEMVNFYHDLVELAARHHLTVDFHGSYKPTGIRRTWPNLLTREGVLGNEYNKWSDRVTPRHNVTIPFTRMLAGPMDYTPGGFRHLPESLFVAQDSAPYVMGTRAHQLAMLVVFESPLQVLPDSPYNYRSSPAGLEFLKHVPTTWDDTIVIDGYPGSHIVMARKAGASWYLGAMTGSESRRIGLSLDFLSEGATYLAEIYADAPTASTHPSRLSMESRSVRKGDVLIANMVKGGGLAVRFERQ